MITLEPVGHVRSARKDLRDPVLDIKPVMVEFLPRSPIRQPRWSHELMRDYWASRPPA